MGVSEVAKFVADSQAFGGHDSWPNPQPLPAGLPDVPAFVPDLLPAALRPWVMDIADRTQCPPDFPAVAAMVAAGAVMGRQIAIRPKRRDDWTVIPNLWGAVIGRPGLLKTPSLASALAPVRAHEERAAAEHAEALRQADAERTIAKARRSVRQSDIRNALKVGNDDKARALARDEGAEDGPARRRYIANDTTVEALGAILNENPRGVLVFRDELIGFLKTMDREGHEGDRAFYLEAWDGKGRFTYDRIGRGTIDIEAACVSIIGGIQPGPLSDYLAAAVRGGVGDDGLIQRFQLAVWPDAPREFVNVDRWPNSGARQAVSEVFRRLDGIDFEAIGAERDYDGVPFLRFDDAAQDAFDGWRCQLERRLRAGDLHLAIEAHLAKYRSLVPSLALISHVVDGGCGPVPMAALVRAAAWAEYLEGHAWRLYASVTHSDADAARRLAAKITAGEVPDPFSSRDLWRKGWAGLSSREKVQAGIEALADLDWLAVETKPTTGRTATIYRVNPKVRGGGDALD